MIHWYPCIIHSSSTIVEAEEAARIADTAWEAGIPARAKTEAAGNGT